jgi:hypothetical protein
MFNAASSKSMNMQGWAALCEAASSGQPAKHKEAICGCFTNMCA